MVSVTIILIIKMKTVTIILIIILFGTINPQVIGLAAFGLLITILASILAVLAQRKRWYCDHVDSDECARVYC